MNNGVINAPLTRGPLDTGDYIGESTDSFPLVRRRMPIIVDKRGLVRGRFASAPSGIPRLSMLERMEREHDERMARRRRLLFVLAVVLAFGVAGIFLRSPEIGHQLFARCAMLAGVP